MMLHFFLLISCAAALDDHEAALKQDSECTSAECTLSALQLNSAAMTADLNADAAVDVDGDFSNSSSDFPLYGYHHWATTTMYGDAPRAACGGIDTHRLVQGTRYHNVASAQSMWRNCNGNGACWCGQAGGGSGTTGMGCLSCAKGRFLRSAYGQKGKALYSLAEEEAEDDSENPFMSEEIVVVVGDLCPHPGNEDWCPNRAGVKNAYGSFNHLDFSHYPNSVPHSRSIPNKNFVFSRIDCPADLKQRYHSMSKCR
mmetsp:Transcript_26913/g.43560  ORF Transcript_26913/g.43560 Transcript_26913/m.43560 type:complete len:256 (+) Transcript_26913:61-828(+)